MKTKLNPRIFERAAQLIHDKLEHCCCWSIDSVVWDIEGEDIDTEPYQDFLDKYFNPHNGWAFWWGTEWSPHQQEARILALLLCAAMLQNP